MQRQGDRHAPFNKKQHARTSGGGRQQHQTHTVSWCHHCHHFIIFMGMPAAAAATDQPTRLLTHRPNPGDSQPTTRPTERACVRAWCDSFCCAHILWTIAVFVFVAGAGRQGGPIFVNRFRGFGRRHLARAAPRALFSAAAAAVRARARALFALRDERGALAAAAARRDADPDPDPGPARRGAGRPAGPRPPARRARARAPPFSFFSFSFLFEGCFLFKTIGARGP